MTFKIVRVIKTVQNTVLPYILFLPYLYNMFLCVATRFNKLLHLFHIFLTKYKEIMAFVQHCIFYNAHFLKFTMAFDDKG